MEILVCVCLLICFNGSSTRAAGTLQVYSTLITHIISLDNVSKSLLVFLFLKVPPEMFSHAEVARLWRKISGCLHSWVLFGPRVVHGNIYLSIKTQTRGWRLSLKDGVANPTPGATFQWFWYILKKLHVKWSFRNLHFTVKAPHPTPMHLNSFDCFSLLFVSLCLVSKVPP